MATITLYAGKINQMPNLIKDVRKTVKELKSELEDLSEAANKVLIPTSAISAT